MPSVTSPSIDVNPNDASPPFPTRRWTVEEFRRLCKAEVLGEEDRVELLEGWIVDKATHDPPHARVAQLATKILTRMLPPEWGLRVQLPIETEDSEPEPDLAIVPDVDDRYATRHPLGIETALVIEVSDTSLLRDQRKAAIYARAGVVEYWIIDLIVRRIERYRAPDRGAGEYRDVQTLTEDESISLTLTQSTVGSIPIRTLLPAP